MREVVDEYVEAKTSLNKYFNCKDNYFIKPLSNSNWCVHGNDGIFFLTYWEEDTKVNVLVVKKDNKPLIYRAEDYTMIIAIDCVKIAFILKNENENN